MVLCGLKNTKTNTTYNSAIFQQLQQYFLNYLKTYKVFKQGQQDRTQNQITWCWYSEIMHDNVPLELFLVTSSLESKWKNEATNIAVGTSLYIHDESISLRNFVYFIYCVICRSILNFQKKVGNSILRRMTLADCKSLNCWQTCA